MKKTQFNLEEIRSEAKKFYIAKWTEEYLHFSGQKPDLRLSEIYQAYQHLFSKELILQLIEGSKRQEDPRQLNYLTSFLVKNYLGLSVKELKDQVATQDAKATIEVDGKTVSFRQAEGLIANAPHPEQREEINRKRNAVLRRHNEMRQEMVEREHEMARELGYDSYAALWDKIDALQLDRLEQLIKDFLHQTESLYKRCFGGLMETHFQIQLKEMKSWDIHRVNRAPQFDTFFPAETRLDTLKSTVNQIGIDFDRQGILLDLEPRETKYANPFCLPIEVPDRVVLVMVPLEGYYAYKALFHEAGHGLQLSSVHPNMPFEFACTVSSDYATTETFAMLFEFLLFDSRWLDTYLQMPVRQEFVTYFGAIELYKIRRFCAKLLYEIRLHSADTIDGMDENYSNLMSSALKCHVPPERYLVDRQEAFYSAGYAQALMCYAHLREHLRQNYGDAWFTNPKAGVVLKEIWAVGQKYKARELVQQLGYGNLNFAPLIHYMEELLGSD